MTSLLERAGLASLGVRHTEEVFKRKIFYQLKDFIEDSKFNIAILAGPRKCGKSVCLKQIANEYNVKQIYDFKSIDSDDKRMDVFDDIMNIKEGIVLIDEITYLNGFMSRIYDLDSSVEDNTAKGIKDGRKIIITGSQIYALNRAAAMTVSTKAKYIQTSFIDFEEWLVYRNKMSKYGENYCPTDLDFKDFMINSADFCKIYNNVRYISDSLDETIKSQGKSYDIIHGIVDVRNLDCELVIALLYSYMAKLHRRVSRQKLSEPINGILAVRDTAKMRNSIKQSEMIKLLEDKFEYLSNKKVSGKFKDLSRAIILLEQLDLITITEIVDNISINRDYYMNSDDLFDCNIDAFMYKYNVCVKHPMFFFNMVKEIVPEIEDLEHLSNAIYGSALECYFKGLLSYKNKSNLLYSYYYNIDNKEGEIDLVDFEDRVLYEVTASDTHSTTHLDRVHDTTWDKIMVSGNKDDMFNNHIRNEYYPGYILKLNKEINIDDISKLKYPCLTIKEED